MNRQINYAMISFFEEIEGYAKRNQLYKKVQIVNIGLVITIILLGSETYSLSRMISVSILGICLYILATHIFDLLLSSIIRTVQRIKGNHKLDTNSASNIKGNTMPIVFSPNTSETDNVILDDTVAATSPVVESKKKTRKEKPTINLDRSKLRSIFSCQISDEAFEFLINSFQNQNSKLQAGDYGKLIYKLKNQASDTNIFADEMYSRRNGITQINFCKLITTFYEAIGINCPKDTEKYYNQATSEIIDGIYNGFWAILKDKKM